MNKITCGVCARNQGIPLEDRKEMGKLLMEGDNVCECGRTVTLTNGRMVNLIKLYESVLKGE